MAGEAEGCCSCEGICHGGLGPVHDDEQLARVVTHPNHFRKDGTFKPGMFPLTHIRGEGLSLMRSDRMDEPELTRQAHAVAGCKPGETIRGLRTCSARELRAVTDGEGRSLCVKDDPVMDEPPLPDNPAHAITIRTRNQDEPEILRLQGVLVDLFGPLVSISDLFK
jgi:hypothetical protein